MAPLQILGRRVRAQKCEVRDHEGDVDLDLGESEKLVAEVEDTHSDNDKHDGELEKYAASDVSMTNPIQSKAYQLTKVWQASLSTSSSNLSPTPLDTLETISFGTLAAVQSPLNSSRKRKRSVADDINNMFPEASERQAGKKDHRTHARSSKHAPTEISSKKAVSRRRDVVVVPKINARDPRFESFSWPINVETVKRNYAFLDTYRASEIANLKDALRKTKDEGAKGKIKREIIRMEAQQKTKAAKEAEQAVLREHRKKEREAVEKGKKPYFLKKGEAKKNVLVRRFEGLGEKRVEKVIERRRKKKAAKERRGMPDYRRGVGVNHGGDGGGAWNGGLKGSLATTIAE
ncbi:MAG: rRNA biogenesis protein rrp36 [Icmadophila ericetorum]|nr:rRNA biogenesis protein rrp36 [Icmadophila ericetorum]